MSMFFYFISQLKFIMIFFLWNGVKNVRVINHEEKFIKMLKILEIKTWLVILLFIKLILSTLAQSFISYIFKFIIKIFKLLHSLLFDCYIKWLIIQ